MRFLIYAAFVVLTCSLAGCAHHAARNDDTLQREALAGIGGPVPSPLPTRSTALGHTDKPPQDGDISLGTGQFVRMTALETPRPRPSGGDAVNFNFENQPIQAAV